MSIQTAIADVSTAIEALKRKNSGAQEEAAAIKELEGVLQFLQAAAAKAGTAATFRQHVQNSPQPAPTMTTLNPKGPVGGYNKTNIQPPPAGEPPPLDRTKRKPEEDDNL